MVAGEMIYQQLLAELAPKQVTLVAVSKTKSPAEILVLYDLGQRDFGENYVQELVEKYALLPKDIRWHFIGHLQGNKVKQIVPFVHLIHSVDSEKLLKEINNQAAKLGRIINCLLQVHIAEEQSKFGFSAGEIATVFSTFGSAEDAKSYQQVRVMGIMGMASFSDDMEKVKQEFRTLKAIYDKYKNPSANGDELSILSMGMTADYRIAIAEGSTMVRIGSLLFGAR